MVVVEEEKEREEKGDRREVEVGAEEAMAENKDTTGAMITVITVITMINDDSLWIMVFYDGDFTC